MRTKQAKLALAQPSKQAVQGKVCAGLPVLALLNNTATRSARGNQPTPDKVTCAGLLVTTSVMYGSNNCRHGEHVMGHFKLRQPCEASATTAVR